MLFRRESYFSNAILSINLLISFFTVNFMILNLNCFINVTAHFNMVSKSNRMFAPTPTTTTFLKSEEKLKTHFLACRSFEKLCAKIEKYKKSRSEPSKYLSKIINCKKWRQNCSRVKMQNAKESRIFFGQNFLSRLAGRAMTDVAHKCKTLCLKRSPMCEFECNHPEAASHIYHKILPKLLDAADKSQTPPLMENFLNVSHVFENNSKMQHNQNARFKIKNYGRNRRKRDIATADDREVCANTFQLSDETALFIHKASGLMVPTYTYIGLLEGNISFQQQFKIAHCFSNTQIQLEIRGKIFACKETYSDVLATIIVRQQQMTKGQFQNCHPLNSMQSNRFICHDWIRVPTHCKLYFRDA